MIRGRSVSETQRGGFRTWSTTAANAYRESSQADILNSMPLTNEQITRYSRQIIVPKMGGHAQERLLSSRIVVIAAPENLEEPLAYRT
jgi:hypothetical protein